MFKWILSILIICYAFSGYIIYSLYQQKQYAKLRYMESQQKIMYLSSETERLHKIIKNTEQNKKALEKKSIEMEEKLNNALKNNKCSDEPVPSNISEQLHERANQIRQSN